MSEQHEFAAHTFAASEALFDTRVQGVAFSNLYQTAMEAAGKASEGRVFVVNRVRFTAAPSFERGPFIWEAALHIQVTFTE